MADDFHNISIIAQRWPSLAKTLSQQDISCLNASLVKGREETISIDGIQLSSRHNRAKEAQLLVSQIPDDAEVINLYGTALGDLQQAILQRKNIRLLRVFILNEAVFSLVLKHTDQSSWLNDPRVSLQTPLANEEVKHPFISIAPELSLASDQHLKLRDHILNENQTNFIYKNHINNSASINEQINKNIDLIKSDNDVQSLFNSRRHSKAFVIGTGPSLERCYTYIKSACKNENILIIAVDTAFKALTANSIKPDIVVTVDEETNTNELSPQHSEGISLVYFPRTNINVLSAWRGKRYTSYSTSPAYNRISETHPKGRLYSGGSVIHPAVDLAVKMGANSITLFGCDFGFHSNKTHAEWKEGELGLDYTNNQGQVKNGYGEMIATVPNFRSYLCNLENYIKLHPHITFYNSCRYGALIAGTEYIEAKL